MFKQQSKLMIKCEETEKEPHPHCPHGPSLLFYRIQGNSNTGAALTDLSAAYYGCSAHRDKKYCSFHLPATDITPYALQKRYPVNAQIYRKVRQMLLQSTSSERNFCHKCQSAFTCNEVKLHEGHEVVRGISNEMMKNPTSFLSPLSNDKTEAQYFFDKKSLKFFVDSFRDLDIKKIVCVGAPRLHEYTKQNCLQVKSFLLDYDHRFFYFYDDSEYAWYNMCNNHFFENDGQKRFMEFLKEEGSENTLIFTDPPFGCRTEPIVNTLREIFRLNVRINNRTYRTMPTFWVFPYFSENYIRQIMPEMKMCDYKINYTNHESYHDGEGGRKLGSPVRLFTNVPLQKITLPADEGYKYCMPCKRWTAIENVHCNKCTTCPSKNGNTYRHCNQCGLCVKPNYVHCVTCRRCTQRLNHNCTEYQKNIRCWICTKVGHSENSCAEWKHYVRQHKITKAIRLEIKSESIVCLICFRFGHNEMQCSKRNCFIREISFLGETQLSFKIKSK